jgi:hypothetical protein
VQLHSHIAIISVRYPYSPWPIRQSFSTHPSVRSLARLRRALCKTSGRSHNLGSEIADARKVGFRQVHYREVPVRRRLAVDKNVAAKTPEVHQ